MTERKRLFHLLLIMATVAVVVGVVTIHLLYEVAVEQQLDRLAELARCQALLLDTAAESRGGDVEATLRFLAGNDSAFEGFAETGEFTLGYQQAGTVYYFAQKDGEEGYDVRTPTAIPAGSPSATALEEAIHGRSGTMVTIDYRGVEVLAAHEAVEKLGWGLVAKIDLAEVRAPFVRSGVLAGCAGILAMVVGSGFFLWLTSPLIRRVEESEIRTRTVLETAVDPIITIDESGVIQTFNGAAEKTFGYTASEAIGRNVSLLMPSPYREEHDGYIESYLQSGEKRIIGIGREVLGRRNDDTTFPMELAVSEVELGKRKFFTGIVRDISERKEAQQQLSQLNRELGEKNKELETIVYVTSHDLRSPLVNIQGFSNELTLACKTVRAALERAQTVDEIKNELSPVLEKDVPEALHFILSGAAKMDSLLRGLLRVSRLGRSALTIRELDMNSLLRRIEAAMEYQIKESRVELSIEDLPACVGDEVQINQVFSNLLENAIKYRDRTGPTRIRVSGRRSADGCVYCVEDNGLGIALDHQPKVFEIFHRLDNSVAEGEGLGLTIARVIVSRHNGKLWLESEPERGSRFFVSLRAKTEP